MDAIVLAAGWGRRFGGPKALAAMPGGGTFLDAVLAGVRAAGPCRTVVVLGPWWDGRVTWDAGPDAVAVLNPDPDLGQVWSIRLGLAAASPAASGALVALVDHPMVEPATYAALARAHAGAPEAIVVPVVATAAGRSRGHPVVFPRRFFADLHSPAATAGGARAVVAANAGSVMEIVVEDAGVLVDIDRR